MAVFWTYLVTALVTALPVIWMMLGAWMGVPIIPTEWFSLTGSILVLVATFLSLSFRKVASVLALVGLSGICCYWVFEPVRTVRQTPWSAYLVGLLLAVLSLCAASAFLAIRDLRVDTPPLVSRRFRVGALSVSGVCFVLIAGALYWQHKASERHPSYYFIPDGYVGWIVIHYGASNAPVTPMRGGAYEFTIPADGEYFTSSTQEYRWAKDRYFYASSNGTRHEIPETNWGGGGLIWNESSGTFEKEGKFIDRTQQFFVGTEAQLHQLGESNMDGVIPGNLLAPKGKPAP